MKTRAEWTEKVLVDLAALWRHMDETDSAPKSGSHARGMVDAGCRILLEAGNDLVLSDALAQATLLLCLVRETMLERQGAEPS